MHKISLWRFYDSVLHSVYAKILVTILLCFALPLSALFLYSYRTMETTIRQKIVQQANTYLDRVDESLQDTVDQIGQTASYISSDWRVNDLLTTYCEGLPDDQSLTYSYSVPPHMTRYDYLNFATNLSSLFTNYTSTWLPAGAEIFILLNDGHFLCTWTSDNTNFDVLTEILIQAGDASFCGPHPPLMHYAKGEQLSLKKELYNLYDTRQHLGTVLITVPVSSLENILADYENEGTFSFCLLNGQNRTIAAAGDEALLSHSTDPSDEDFLGERTIYGPSWRLCLLAPHDHVFLELDFLRGRIIGLGSCLIILLTAATLFILYRFLSPLRQLALGMAEIERGNWDMPPLPVQSKDEIGSLTERFNQLIAELRRMFEKVKETERQKGELRYEALLAQINPHFLFNTLNSIRWMATMVHADNIVETIRSLARLLEISMNRQSDVIPIAEELKNLHSYLDIQSLRYNGLFTTSFDVDERLEGFACVKLIFQPIVENSILYNIQEERPLDIHISGYLEDTDAVFVITDNGKGMSPERIAQIFADDIVHEKRVFRGIGLNYVRQSLRLKYGESSRLSITSTPGEGTEVTVRFPAIPYEEKGGAEA